MAKNQKQLLGDEILQFLNTHASFQQLDKIEQQYLLEHYKHDENFAEILEMSMSFQEIIQEVEATMPKMGEKDDLLLIGQQKPLIKERSVVEGNVYFVPFHDIEEDYSPMIILMQQSENMKSFEIFCKGMIMPFFHLCATQKRDLMIIPFSETIQEPLFFKKGLFQIALFDRFVYEYKDNEAMIVPVLEYALAIFKEDTVCNERDVIMFTDNQFNDYQAFVQEDYATQFEEHKIDISVFAMNKDNFDIQPIPFAQNIYIANESCK